jgi:hypothetical protein
MDERANVTLIFRNSAIVGRKRQVLLPFSLTCWMDFFASSHIKNTCDMEKSPITAGTKLMPDCRTNVPKVKRGKPESRSDPIVLMNRPMAPASRPLIMLPLASVPMTVSPNTASMKYSGGPNFRDKSDKGGDMNSSAKALAEPPTTDEKVATLSALLNSPFWVSTKPSIAVAAEAEVPGVCSNMAAKDPP